MRNDDDNKRLPDREKVHSLTYLRACFIASYFVAGGTAIGMWLGISTLMEENEGPLTSTVLPFVLASGFFVILAVVWHALFHAAADIESERKKVAVVCLGLLASLTAMATSTWTLATLIGGRDAVKASQTAFVEKAQEALETLQKNAALDRTLVSSTASTSSELASTADLEEATGGVSGRGPGLDQWTMNIRSASKALEMKSAQLSEADAGRSGKMAEAAMATGQAQRAIAESKDDEFQKLTLRISQQLSEANQVRLSAMLAELGGGMLANQASNLLTKSFNKVKAVAENIAGQTTDLSVPWFKVLTPGTAVISYADKVILAWVLPAALEFVPFLLLCLLIVMPRRIRDEDHISVAFLQQPVDRTSIGDVQSNPEPPLRAVN